MEEKNRHQLTIYFATADLLERVRESARQHHRSTSAEALVLLEQSLGCQDQEAKKPKRQVISA
jgi:hypothetical protein